MYAMGDTSPIGYKRRVRFWGNQMPAKYFAAVFAALLFTGQITYSQQTTNTNCNLSGNNVNCTSNTTDYGAQQQRAYEQGQQIGNALGTGLALAMQSHSQEKWVKKFCAAHPGGDWRWYRKSDGQNLATGHCPNQDEKAVIAANEFMAHHKNYVPCEENSSAITAYIEDHNLDPRRKKSYEQAFKELMKDNQLKLYSN
jgi:hypothetical protein